MKRCLLVAIITVLCCLLLCESAHARSLDRAMVAITIDDGGSSIVTAYQILAKYKIPGTVYIVTDWIGDGRHLTWNQLWLLYWYGWEIGSHTASHADLTLLGDAGVYSELEEAQKSLLQHGLLGEGSFASPYGAYNERVIADLRQLGFVTSSRQAWTEDSPFNEPATFNQWALNVVSIKRNTTYASIKTLLDQAVAGRKWLILVVHDVVQAPADDYQISTAMLTQLASYIGTLKAGGKIDAVTVSKGAGKTLYYKNLP